MNYKISGLSSLVFVFFALAIAAFQLYKTSPLIGIIYSLSIPISFFIVLYCYCRKCPHVASKTCRHVLFGWIVAKIFKSSVPSKYSLLEIIFTVVPLLIIFMYPQYGLYQNKTLFTVFWLLMIVAVVIVRSGVCPRCENLYCVLCSNGNKKGGK